MTAAEVMTKLKSLGNEQTRKTWLRHGATGEVFGVKIGDMKPIQKQIKKDYKLSLELFKTGNVDAMYFAGLISDPDKMTEADLDRWAKAATWGMIAEYSVAWTAAESPHAFAIGQKWIDSDLPHVATAGWNTLSSYVALTPDDKIDLKKYEKLLNRVAKEIHKAPERVKYTMNGFVIAVGGYVAPLADKALAVAEKIGKVEVDMGDTDCKVPSAPDYIRKMLARGPAKKRKTVKC